jgi:nucleotide-binding universal stress UspA family protein
MARTIILGYDGSACSKNALDTAVSLARDVPGSKIIVVYGHETNLSVGGGPMAAELMVPELQGDEPAADPAITSLLDEATELVAAQGVPVESVLERQRPSAALVHAARDWSADMIVVGTHGRDAIRGVLLGSTPFKLLHHSPIPVVVVPLKH